MHSLPILMILWFTSIHYTYKWLFHVSTHPHILAHELQLLMGAYSGEYNPSQVKTIGNVLLLSPSKLHFSHNEQ